MVSFSRRRLTFSRSFSTLLFDFRVVKLCVFLCVLMFLLCCYFVMMVLSCLILIKNELWLCGEFMVYSCEFGNASASSR